jgi:hypothetical protein
MKVRDDHETVSHAGSVFGEYERQPKRKGLACLRSIISVKLVLSGAFAFNVIIPCILILVIVLYSVERFIVNQAVELSGQITFETSSFVQQFMNVPFQFSQTIAHAVWFFILANHVRWDQD